MQKHPIRKKDPHFHQNRRSQGKRQSLTVKKQKVETPHNVIFVRDRKVKCNFCSKVQIVSAKRD